MDDQAWKEILAEEMEVYKDDTTWEDNGIIRNLRSVDHPWTCKSVSYTHLTLPTTPYV